MAGTVALLGSYHAVSGASAAIQGVAAWTKITNGVQAGLVTSSATGTSGQPFLYKIIITTPATTGAEKDYYKYDTLPPGLTINTNVGGADGAGTGFIAGTPTQGGTFPVTLTAGNTLWPQTVTKAITITIAGGGGATPPGVSSPPTNQTVTAGANVTFRVTATGTAPLSYLWKFNTVAIPGATTNSLQLINVQTTNSGTYSVTITNSAGSTNASATLTVNDAATGPLITFDPQSMTVSNGAPAGFSVTATGTPPLSYQWLKGASALVGATASSYNLASVTTNDAGIYSVLVTNIAGSVTSKVATLTVLFAPSIVTPPHALTVTNGDNALFTVAAGGSPPLTYQWKLNGKDLAGGTTSSYTIANAQTGDQGDYSVVVTNAVGIATSPAAHLTVQTQAAGPFQLANLALTNGSPDFDVTGPSQTNFVIWGSTDLTHWNPLSTNFSTSGTVHFSDTNAVGAGRFYRASLSP
jgi:hypothetical protein